jgi:tRNA pseudouridine32 synthase / 23S rRNA pseudouridine746 synthase
MIPFEIIENNPEFIIIDKPADISFHNENNQLGFYNQVKQQLAADLWPVHRLDKITSGLIIFAKNVEAAAKLGQLFENRAVEKVYLAISDQKPKKKQGKLAGDMQKSRNGSWKLSKRKTNPAITQFKSGSIAPNLRLFWLIPKTGKTHQLRVALKSIGAAILGDSRYSGSQSDRAYLHAFQLKFNWQQRELCFHCWPKQGRLFKLEQTRNVIEQLLLEQNNTPLNQ